MKIACFISKMNDFWAKTAFTATSATLLPPLLPPLNILYIRCLTLKVAVVAVKITKHLV